MIGNRSKLYLLGIFITALGSMTYAATLPAILYKSGISAVYIGFLIGTMRLNGFLVNAFLGHIGDKYNPKTVLIFCEFGAAIGSVLILLTWEFWNVGWLIPFAIANNIRVFFTSLQVGSTQKLGRNFDQSLNMKGRYAIFMSGATNSALLLGGVLAMSTFDYIDIKSLVIFDALTFFINGLIVILIFKDSEGINSAVKIKGPSINISAYWRALPALAVADMALSLALTGANTLNLRLLEGSPQLVPLMPTLFGGAAFLVSTLGFDKNFHPNSKVLWGSLSASLLMQGLLIDEPIAVVMFAVFRNLSYWIIYNRISRELMKNAPNENFSAIASGRGALNVLILAMGEFWVGATKVVPMIIEMSWRSVVALLGPFYLNKKKHEI